MKFHLSINIFRFMGIQGYKKAVSLAVNKTQLIVVIAGTAGHRRLNHIKLSRLWVLLS